MCMLGQKAIQETVVELWYIDHRNAKNVFWGKKGEKRYMGLTSAIYLANSKFNTFIFFTVHDLSK